MIFMWIAIVFQYVLLLEHRQITTNPYSRLCAVKIGAHLYSRRQRGQPGASATQLRLELLDEPTKSGLRRADAQQRFRMGRKVRRRSPFLAFPILITAP
jgi:hypothetical protein